MVNRGFSQESENRMADSADLDEMTGNKLFHLDIELTLFFTLILLVCRFESVTSESAKQIVANYSLNF